MNIVIKTASIATLLSLSVSMACADTASDNIQRWSSQVTKMTAGKAVVKRTVSAPEGMTAIIIDAAPGELSQGEVLAWGLPNGLMMIGNLYDREGGLVNARFNLAKNDLSKEMVKIVNVSLGDKNRLTSEGEGKDVVVVLDPSCGHCQKMWKRLHGNVPKGYRVTWLPVNLYATKDGDLKAAYASTGLDAMNTMMTKGSVPEGFDVSKLTKEQGAAAAMGMVLLGLIDRKATPMVIYNDIDGKQVINYGDIDFNTIK